MALIDTSLANICDEIRNYMLLNIVAPEDNASNWITVGAPGVNYESSIAKNALNLFFYRFEPFSFAADALPGDVQFIKVFCIVTAFGVDIETPLNGLDASAGFNELRMLSEVMRLFQEQPIMMLEGKTSGQKWHTQFIPRPLADEQINQIWSTQGNTVYRPSLVYEIALAPIEPELMVKQSVRVSAIGTQAVSDMSKHNNLWPDDKEVLFFPPSSIEVDTSNLQWAPAIAMVTGLVNERESHLTLNIEVNAVGDVIIPDIDIWIAGDPLKDVSLVGQLLLNDQWLDIDELNNIKADTHRLNMNALPNVTNFTLQGVNGANNHWSNFDQSLNHWQLQLFAERRIKFDPQTATWNDVNASEAEMRIRSNPVLITVIRN
ncbi:Pvc16 family protein [sulfur-oxidizing endosymbiont of Gigantopelta aegis]|uniref:Pvc16 family protein n=1 Tax=sulfur-oxidizing endosymbiont of Gigantopelta aegis TaxID=2794934 RepID=UPI0018DDDC89|nr:Pvc16 family protein [sulfur-oxidizing endosymbiont of Gigantopelta aegis]